MELQYDCDCMEEQCRIGTFELTEVWSERADGFNERVDLCRCLTCDRYWLRYSLVEESNPSFGYWFRGAMEPAEAIDLTGYRALALLGALPWHFFGGPYYRSSGEYANGPAPIPSHAGDMEELPWAA